MYEKVTMAVDQAITAIQQVLSEQLAEGRAGAARKASDDPEALAIRLEG